MITVQDMINSWAFARRIWQLEATQHPHIQFSEEPARAACPFLLQPSEVWGSFRISFGGKG